MPNSLACCSNLSPCSYPFLESASALFPMLNAPSISAPIDITLEKTFSKFCFDKSANFLMSSETLKFTSSVLLI